MDYNITYRQKDKGWQFIVSYKDNGKWKQKSKQGFATKKEAKPVAEKMVLELKSTINKQKTILNSNYDIVTFKEVRVNFLEHKKLYVKTASYISYNQRLRVFKNLDDKVFIKIKKIDVQNIFDDLLKNNTKYNTLKSYRGAFKLLLLFYKENYDPDYKLDIINIKLPKKDETKKKALTKSELDAVLNFFKNKSKQKQWQYITCLIAATCGLRFSEIMGLKWSDIDDKKLTLTIDKQYRQDINGVWEFITPKSKNSTRTVPIPITTYNELLEYKKQNPTDLTNRIIINNPRTAQYLLNRTLNKIANISLHELRHTYITLLIANNIDFKTVAKLAGHDVEQTMKIYSHVTDDMLELASNKIAKIF